MDKKEIGIFVVIICVILALVVYKISEPAKVDYSYTIEISDIESDEINLLIPFSVNNNGTLNEDILSELAIKSGDGSIGKFESENGNCLNISTSDNLTLKSKGTGNTDIWKYDSLSMMEYDGENDEIYYYIWSSANADIKLNFFIEDKTSSTSYEINSSVIAGWNLIEAEVTHTEV